MAIKAQGRADADGGVIYFIEAEGLGLVKIGFSRNLSKRLRVLRASSPVPLLLIKTVRASIQTEQALIAVFSKYNAHHEWFKYHATLRQFIQGLKEKQAFSPEMIFRLRK